MQDNKYTRQTRLFSELHWVSHNQLDVSIKEDLDESLLGCQGEGYYCVVMYK